MAFHRSVFSLTLFAALAWAGISHGASPTVNQSGNVTPGHSACWTTTGVIKDCGTPSNPANTGGVGVLSTNQQAICTQNAAAGLPGSQLCLGVTPSGAYVTLNNQNGGADLPLYFVVNGSTYPFPFSNAGGLPGLNASNFGVKADGVTSDDVALSKALAACTAQGTTLYMPAGRVLLDGTGNMTGFLQNCTIIGAGQFSGEASLPGSWGTTFLLTSKTVPPFFYGSFWGMSGVNFFWPNQDGLTPYPALMSDNGQPSGLYWMDHVNIINAYDGIIQAPGNQGTATIIISNSMGYAVHDLFRLHTVGDTIHFSNMSFSPGPWLAVYDHNSVVAGFVDNASTSNSVIHASASTDQQGVLNIDMVGASIFDWRYMFLLDNHAGIGESKIIGIGPDSVQTIVDASSGGSWTANISASQGGGACVHISLANSTASGNAPCFNMGANSVLNIFGWQSESFAYGSFVVSSGSNIVLNNVSMGRIGAAADGQDYYAVQMTTNTNGTFTGVKDSAFNGIPSSVHSHGVKTVNAGSNTTIQNNIFTFFNDVINIQSSPITIITGNQSADSVATSVAIGGTNGVIYGQNNWDISPNATCTGCGTGYSINGALRGTITMGTGTVTTFSLQLPFVPYGPSGACQFNPQNSGVTLGGVAFGAPPAISVSVSTNIAGGGVNFDCTGQQ